MAGLVMQITLLLLLLLFQQGFIRQSRRKMLSMSC
jgi:hypothetical protein